MNADPNAEANRRYWNSIAGEYQQVTRIACDAFHLGPLLPDADSLGLLPPLTPGDRCLEIGCGAAQNSIFLASRGCRCTAIDVAESQLEHGRALAREHGADIDFRSGSMDDLDALALGDFDFVHSTYALPFSRDPAAMVAAAAGHLRTGGHLLLVTGHPIFAGEWIEIEEEGEGMFLHDYFHPPADTRMDLLDEESIVHARFAPVAEVVEWVLAAKLRLVRLAEPEPLPLPTMDKTRIAAQVPYESDAWRGLYPQLARTPVVLALLARREPDATANRPSGD